MGSYWDASGKLVDGRFELAVRNVEQVYIFNALAITDTLAKDSGFIDVSKYRNYALIAMSTLNQSVDIGLIANDLARGQFTIYDGTAWVNAVSTKKVTIPATTSGDTYDLNTFWTFLKDTPQLKKIELRATCAVAPTTGSITIAVLGVPN